MKRCPQCGSQLAKSAPAESAEYCSNCKDQSKNTNRKRGEDRNQSFGGETHSKQPKGNNHNSGR
ncbi:hypothetical protein IB232_13785 [Pseudomonas sp. PDM15]|jgi:predicted amidophosphoribosyltransferase|uniref:hypothetical protein n=1 Tax=Pseudomonas sp. PDM15 TaxID=2769303 RepID=UPI001786E26E|nr:hypothetical protein [Pseudomonas sp. PDM15]MBD9426402.1 hypothetical protein [Pseudomonas sp. PDM15]